MCAARQQWITGCGKTSSISFSSLTNTFCFYRVNLCWHFVIWQNRVSALRKLKALCPKHILFNSLAVFCMANKLISISWAQHITTFTYWNTHIEITLNRKPCLFKRISENFCGRDTMGSYWVLLRLMYLPTHSWFDLAIHCGCGGRIKHTQHLLTTWKSSQKNTWFRTQLNNLVCEIGWIQLPLVSVVYIAGQRKMEKQTLWNHPLCFYKSLERERTPYGSKHGMVLQECYLHL